MRALLDAMEGRPYEALMELEHLVTNVKIDPRDLIHPAFDELSDKPEFKELEDLQLQRMNSEREKMGLMPLPGMDVDSVAQGEKR
jgi:hypothetical protein